MAFESLTEKLQNVFRALRGKGRLSEEDVKSALKDVKMALLEADVNFKVVKQFISNVTERAVGQDVMEGLNPGQMIVKIVNEELTSIMGSEVTDLTFRPGKEVTVFMLCGLQGAGKTTAAAKLATRLKLKSKKTLLVACDIYRPAAIDQLKRNGEKAETEVFSLGTDVKPAKIAKEAYDYAVKNAFNVVILDTAGRLHIDDSMMDELKEIKAAVDVHETLLVVDAMTGQDAVNVATEFNEKVGIDGVILSKADGDTRGGAALSVKAVTGKPILFASNGEKLNDMEPFYPDRMANRILGMGDVLTLIDKVQAANEERDVQKDAEMAKRLKKGKFDFNDYLESMKQMKKLGGFASILSMLPGMGIKAGDLDSDEAELKLKRTEAIVLSMTKQERENPKLMSPQRKFRIAKGAGVDISEVNRFIKQFEQSQKMMKQFPGMMGKFGGKKGRFPF
ncbi:MAG: signal recognition particle protein [Lachnospiraceae bacterium]|nr:signal recognition particle protein [Lachnospiraceae bacterium]